MLHSIVRILFNGSDKQESNCSRYSSFFQIYLFDFLFSNIKVPSKNFIEVVDFYFKLHKVFGLNYHKALLQSLSLKFRQCSALKNIFSNSKIFRKQWQRKLWPKRNYFSNNDSNGNIVNVCSFVAYMSTYAPIWVFTIIFAIFSIFLMENMY